MQKIGFYLFYSFIWVITLLPLPILYLLSDFLYLIIFYLVRYRRNISHKNLITSFPDKSYKEIKQIEKKFYHYFCDSFIESMKQLHFSKKDIKKHVILNNHELFDDLFTKGKNIILYLGHYGNWEWALGMHNYLNENTHYNLYPIYKKLSNKYFNNLYKYLREKYGAIAVEQREVRKTILTLDNETKKSIFVMAADQRPNKDKLNYWIPFLNQDTPFITGTENLAKQLNFAVVYLEIERTTRGYYNWNFTLMEENPQKLPDFSLTQQFAQLLEKTIRRAPQYYLWTHKRWLYKKEKGN